MWRPLVGIVLLNYNFNIVIQFRAYDRDGDGAVSWGDYAMMEAVKILQREPQVGRCPIRFVSDFIITLITSLSLDNIARCTLTSGSKYVQCYCLVIFSDVALMNRILGYMYVVLLSGCLTETSFFVISSFVK